MRRKAGLILSLTAALVLFSVPARADAAEFLGGPSITIGADEVIEGDVYASGGTIVVRGGINGDLIATGGNINMQGAVAGDLVAAGGNINITGPVLDDIRVAGGQIYIVSDVGGDVVVGGGSVFIDGTVGGDLIVGSGNLEMTGTVEGDARIGAGEATINGAIKGNVEADAGNQLTIGPKGRIEGDLDYKSKKEVKLESGAQVLGRTTRTVPETSVLGMHIQDSLLARIAKSVVSRARWFLGVVLVGLLLLWLFPRVARGVAETPMQSPWQSLGLSVAVLLLAPIALLVLGVLAIVVGGIAAVPILLAPGAAYIVLLSLAAPVVALLIGALIYRRWRGVYEYGGWQALVVGAAILAVIGLIPVVNIIATILTILFGFGAWILYLYRSHARTAEV